MTDGNLPWPPLIIAANTPRSIRWRDLLLTLLMWILFAIMLDAEFELFLGGHLERWGFGDFHREANWLMFFERLIPFLLTILLLVGLLILGAVLTLRRRRNSLLLPMPLPLGLAEQCRRSGMDEAALIAARALPVAVVHIDDEQRFHVVAPRTEPTLG